MWNWNVSSYKLSPKSVNSREIIKELNASSVSIKHTPFLAIDHSNSVLHPYFYSLSPLLPLKPNSTRSCHVETSPFKSIQPYVATCHCPITLSWTNGKLPHQHFPFYPETLNVITTIFYHAINPAPCWKPPLQHWNRTQNAPSKDVNCIIPPPCLRSHHLHTSTISRMRTTVTSMRPHHGNNLTIISTFAHHEFL